MRTVVVTYDIKSSTAIYRMECNCGWVEKTLLRNVKDRIGEHLAIKHKNEGKADIMMSPETDF